MSVFRLEAANVVPPAQLHAAFGTAFADYLIGPFSQPLALWPSFLARQAVSLSRSRVALRGSEIVAFALVAPRGPRWRLATMGALPQARGSGAAPALLDELIARASAHGLAELELEVFAQNERALRLYRSRGFAELMPLHGYSLAAGAALPAAGQPPQDVGREAALGWLDAAEAAGCVLPLQVSAPVLASSQLPWQAWQQDSAQLVFVAQDDDVQILSLVDRQPAQQAARALLQSLRAAHPALPWRVPYLQAPQLGGDALLALGCRREPLHQYLMRRPLP
ncbi:N-acetyltransferase [Vogesella sp. LIG4]|uniref:GNAT family N-acetyltransferase n=1 Tax=Vogesella sp. LIG4 TaxID=1192162 RepID=UPI00081F89FC|nr:GNAT family N-acetyltransferase [Vogesella sp. LIG4]SCK13203.1 Ribosomal protein S18 acetylase RimI [Vogesella sp. LIG4]